jgi:hypothetical protein
MVTDDVLSNASSEGDIQKIANRIKKYTGSKLNDYSIRISQGAINDGDYSLIITIDTIEVDTSYHFWTGISNTSTKIKYNAKLSSSDGKTLFVLTEDQSNESLDKATEDVGSEISKSVAKFFGN